MAESCSGGATSTGSNDGTANGASRSASSSTSGTHDSTSPRCARARVAATGRAGTVVTCRTPVRSPTRPGLPMPRPVTRPTSDAFGAEDLEAYELLVERFRDGSTVPSDEIELSPYFGALLNAPPFAAALGRLGTLVRAAGDRAGTY